MEVPTYAMKGYVASVRRNINHQMVPVSAFDSDFVAMDSLRFITLQKAKFALVGYKAVTLKVHEEKMKAKYEDIRTLDADFQVKLFVFLL